MPALTLDVPLRLKPHIDAKLSEGYESAQSYLLALVEADQLDRQRASDLLEQMNPAMNRELEAILESRLDGPFVPLEAGWDQRVMEKAMMRVSSRRSHE